jgi:hypothetical protein
VALAAAFFLFLVTPARAPYGGKNALGGRTIASIQEREFDHKLMFYQLCFGVRFTAEKATLERRRVCKAMLVHRLDQELSIPGAYLKRPVEFRCDDTIFTPKSEKGDDAVALKPNKEFDAIDGVFSSSMEHATVAESTDEFARDACNFLTDCKLATTPYKLSFRKLASCFATGNLTHRRILLDEVGAMLFRAKENQTKILYAELLDEAHN